MNSTSALSAPADCTTEAIIIDSGGIGPWSYGCAIRQAEMPCPIMRKPAPMAMSNAPVEAERRQPHSAKPPSTQVQIKNGSCVADAYNAPVTGWGTA
jgi:hypothetical protein